MSADFDLVARELCPDDLCIGVIGPDGRCRECGRVGRSAVSDPRVLGLTPETDGDHDALAGDERELCPDDLCIGLIGADGRCKACGAVASRRHAAAGPAGARSDGAVAAGSDDAGDFDERELCPDDLCIGLIGPDGRCKVCRRPA